MPCNRLKGYKKILQGKETIPNDNQNISEISNETEKKKIRELNEDAYKYLLLSITGDAESGEEALQIIFG